MSTTNNFNYQNRNYPPENDTTSEGGYGAPNTFSPQNQRRADPQAQAREGRPDTGLIDQSLDGGPIGRELQDAQQGTDARTREQFAHEVRRDFYAHSNNSPYGRNPDSAGEMGERLASVYADQRGRRQYEGGGGAGSNDADAGAA